MSNRIKKVQKEINRELMFENEMYYNLYGSLVVCAYMFTEPGKYSVEEINKTWRKFMKGKIMFPTFNEDPKWYGNLLKVFGMEIPKLFPIAFVQSRTNALFAPCIGDQVLPLREDGVSCRTLETGKIYPIDFEERECQNG